MSVKQASKTGTAQKSADVEYMEANFDSDAQVEYLAANSPSPAEGTAAGDTNEPIPEKDLPATTTEGKPVVTLDVGETVKSADDK